jgi:hypothetical protein
MLCALMRIGAISTTAFQEIDWEEAGITKKDFDEWWHNHQMRDQQRKGRELRETLPPGHYQVREEVTHDNRHWFVTAVMVEGGTDVTVAMVTADDKRPHRNERFKVRKS